MVRCSHRATHAVVRSSVEGRTGKSRAGPREGGTMNVEIANNASMAAAAVGVSQDEVAQLANENMAKLSVLMMSLTESDLAMSSSFGPAGGVKMSVEQLAGNVGHLQRHLASIRETLAR